MDFSILIPTMYSRASVFEKIYKEIHRQITELTNVKIEVLYEIDNGEMTIGKKRNLLVSRANSKYLCFIDDDDIISPVFLKTFLPMLEDDYDCASFVGAYYNNGKFMKLFYHSIDNKKWYESNNCYLRPPSHLNMIKTEIVKQVSYKNIRYREDYEFSMSIIESQLVKKEYKIPFIPIYHYVDGIKDNRDKWNYIWNSDYSRISLVNYINKKYIWCNPIK